MLLAQPFKRGARLGDARLELLVGVLPEIDETTVVMARSSTVPARLVQLTEALEGRGWGAVEAVIQQRQRGSNALEIGRASCRERV